MAMLAVPLLTSMGVSAATAGTIATVGGTIFSGLSLIGDYMSQKNLAKSQAQQGIYEQKVAEQNAGQIEAQSQRQTVEALRQRDLVASSAKAKLAAGGDSSDPTSVNLVADIASRGTENAYNELYSGKSRADAVRQGGDMSAYQGRVNSASTKATAMSNLVGGVASLATKYGGGGFKSSGKADPNGLILWDDGTYSGGGYG